MHSKRNSAQDELMIDLYAHKDSLACMAKLYQNFQVGH